MLVKEFEELASPAVALRPGVNELFGGLRRCREDAHFITFLANLFFTLLDLSLYSFSAISTSNMIYVGMSETHISDLMNSNRFSTFDLASF